MARRPAWLVFAISVFVLWFSVMGAFAFLGIVVVEMGGTQRMVGLAATIAALTEIPMFHYSSRLLQRFGPARLLIVAMGVYAFRLLLYAIMPSVTWVLGLALLQGLSYGLFLVSAVAHVNELAPDDAEIDRPGPDGVSDESGEPYSRTGRRLAARSQRTTGPLLQHDGNEPARAGHFRVGVGERTPPSTSGRIADREPLGTAPFYHDPAPHQRIALPAAQGHSILAGMPMSASAAQGWAAKRRQAAAILVSPASAHAGR